VPVLTVANEAQGMIAIRKAAWRLVPFLGLLYFVSFLDRVNVSFAALTMNADLSFTATVFGNAAGIFFLGYVIFEIPSNFMLHKIGARRWIARIMISWGLLSMSMALIRTPWSFYSLRLLLGIAEAGFFPGIILYLTYWFPTYYRGRILGAFMVALPLASVIGAPISTALIDVSWGGLRGWQWLFVLEGAPAVLIGFTVLKFLTDRPEHAGWLTPTERKFLVEQTALEEKSCHGAGMTARHGLLNRKVWVLGLTYFAMLVSLYGFNFWLPQIIASSGVPSHTEVGELTMLPNIVAAVMMYVWGRHCDATGERRWHLALPAFLAMTGLALIAIFAVKPTVVLVGLMFSAVGINCLLPVFWTLPTTVVSGAAAATGIALINALGNVGGYLGSSLMGYSKDVTGDYCQGLSVLAMSMAVVGVMALLVVRPKDRNIAPVTGGVAAKPNER
jgi:ACS family tartrate transporter-like MFS transporter